MYDGDGFVMVHSGRSLPNGNDPVIRNEGVGILMKAAAWRDSGECWEAIGSRIVYARAKLQCSKYHRRRRGRQDVYLSVVSVYAPTYHLPQEDMFYDDLCCLINSISEDDLFFVFSAHALQNI